MNKMRVVYGALVSGLLACAAVPAHAGPYSGAYAGGPDDGFIGCDGVGECSITLDELGNISGAFGGFFGPYDVTLAHVASSVLPAYSGLEVISYSVVGKGGIAALRLVEGAIGVCEFGVTVDGSACTGPNGDTKSDVLVFRPGVIDSDGYGHSIIDVLSDTVGDFVFATDFNVLETGAVGNRTAAYQTTGTGWYCGSPGCSNPPDAQERMTYNFASNSVDNSVPEPASLALLGIGLAGLRFSRREKA